MREEGYLVCAAANGKKCDIVIYGHTHQYSDAECRGVRLLNPGALMKRREPGVSTYMILTFDASGRVDAEKKILENTVQPS